jgi:hypothetical protein
VWGLGSDERVGQEEGEREEVAGQEGGQLLRVRRGRGRWRLPGAVRLFAARVAGLGRKDFPFST